MITKADLEDQTNTDGPHAILLCEACGDEYSANKSDYWQLPDSHKMVCSGCDVGTMPGDSPPSELILVLKQSSYILVKK